MIRTLNYCLLVLQALGCGFLLLVSWSDLTSDVRNPESAMFFGFIGLPITLLGLAIFGWIFWLRSELPDRFRDRFLMASTAMMLVTTMICVLGLMSG